MSDPVDYDALAAKLGGTASVDYDTLATKLGGKAHGEEALPSLHAIPQAAHATTLALAPVASHQPSKSAPESGYVHEGMAGLGRAVEGIAGFPKAMMTPHDTYGATREQEVTMGPAGRFLYNMPADLAQGLSQAADARNQSAQSGENWAGQTLAAAENLPIVGGVVRKAEEAGPGYAKFTPQTLGAATEALGYSVVPKAVERVLPKRVASRVEPVAEREAPIAATREPISVNDIAEQERQFNQNARPEIQNEFSGTTPLKPLDVPEPSRMAAVSPAVERQISRVPRVAERTERVGERVNDAITGAKNRAVPQRLEVDHSLSSTAPATEQVGSLPQSGTSAGNGAGPSATPELVKSGNGEYYVKGGDQFLTFRSKEDAIAAAKMPEAEAWTEHYRQYANYGEGPQEAIIRAKLTNNHPLTSEEKQFVEDFKANNPAFQRQEQWKRESAAVQSGPVAPKFGAGDNSTQPKQETPAGAKLPDNLKPPIVPEADPNVSGNPTAPAGPRWTADRGAIPGEPSMYLDGFGDEARAAIVEQEPRSGGVLYQVVLQNGEELGTYGDIHTAARAAEYAIDHASDTTPLPSTAGRDLGLNSTAPDATANGSLPTESKAAGEVTIRRRIPDSELNTRQLVERLKAENPGEGTQTLYGKFVQARNLKPEINATEFSRYLQGVSADRHIETTTQKFNPTHFDEVTQQQVQIEKTQHGHSVTFANGMTGHDPGELASRYRSLASSDTTLPPSTAGHETKKVILYHNGDKYEARGQEADAVKQLVGEIPSNYPEGAVKRLTQAGYKVSIAEPVTPERAAERGYDVQREADRLANRERVASLPNPEPRKIGYPFNAKADVFSSGGVPEQGIAPFSRDEWEAQSGVQTKSGDGAANSLEPVQQATESQPEPAVSQSKSSREVIGENGSYGKVQDISDVRAAELRSAAAPVVDSRGNKTGWLRVKYSGRNDEGYILIHPEENKALVFGSKDVHSGSALSRSYIEAASYAADNPIAPKSAPEPSGELVVKPLYGNKKAESVTADPAVSSQQSVAPKQTEGRGAITRDEADAEPWKFSANQYQYAHNVHQPWAGEISPVQYQRMSKRGQSQYDATRTAQWQASADIKTEWRQKVMAAFDRGDIGLDSKDLSPEAKSAIQQELISRDRNAKEESLKSALNDNRIQSVNDVQPGDKVWDIMRGRYVTVVKGFKNSVRVRDEAGAEYSVQARALQRQKYDDVKQSVESGQFNRPADSPQVAAEREAVAPQTAEPSELEAWKKQLEALDAKGANRIGNQYFDRANELRGKVQDAERAVKLSTIPETKPEGKIVTNPDKDKWGYQKEYFLKALEPARDAWINRFANKFTWEDISKSVARNSGKIDWTEAAEQPDVRPKEFPDKYIHIEVPGDGKFLVNNNPVAIDRILKSAPQAFSKPKAASQPRMANQNPRATEEASPEQHIAYWEDQLEKAKDELAKVERSSRTYDRQYYKDQIASAEENLAEAKKLREGEQPTDRIALSRTRIAKRTVAHREQ